MQLVDLNQVVISNLMMHLSMTKSKKPDEGLLRHMVLSSIRKYRRKFLHRYGEIVLCCDDKNYWRKNIFPYYKASRKRIRQESKYDWSSIFESINKIKSELKYNFPYKLIQVKTAEADDVIAALCHKYGVYNSADVAVPCELILIISGDKDFVQLQKYENVEQWSPVQKKYIRESNPARFIHEHIMKGDKSDGVPNFLSSDSCFVNGGRQKPIRTVKFSEWAKLRPEDFCDQNMLSGYMRNRQLVDLDYVPENIQKEAIEQFENVEVAPRGHLFPYFMKHKLSNLLDSIGDY